MSEIKKGDRVRLLPSEFEVSCVWTGSSGKWVDLSRDGRYAGTALVAQIEKIEPPVVQFKPGDVIRWKAPSLSGAERYLVLEGMRLAGMSDGTIYRNEEVRINSKYYELVESK